MCGIIGYNGYKKCKNTLIKYLKVIEYRGYDSFGLVFMNDNDLVVHKDVGTVGEYGEPIQTDSTCGLGHVRWATNGLPTKINAHPHIGGDNLALVHNGIIKNVDEIRTRHRHVSQTDTEVLAHYISDNIEDIDTAINKVEGDFAIAFLLKNQDFIYLYCRNTPLYIANANHGNIVASSANVFKNLKYQRVEDNKIVRLGKHYTSDKWTQSVQVGWGEAPVKGFITVREIEEQKNIDLPDDTITLAKDKKIVIFGCGSSYNAANISKFFFSQEVEVLLPDEINYSSSNNYLAISQSGETADILKIAKVVHPYSIINTQHSTLEMLSRKTMHLKCGVEVGVAATKTFTATLLALMSIALPEASKVVKDELRVLFSKVFKKYYPKIPEWMQSVDNMFLLGSGITHYCNIEGSLKFKEMALIHAEAIYLTELKHGPIALINKAVSIVVINKKEHVASAQETISQIKSRGGQFIILANENLGLNEDFIKMPSCQELSSPFITLLYLQLLAAEIGRLKGINIDKPKNLAKCITV
jgi:glucosamine--fructose-6-phosphate aminotransferase (isomerizing)